MALITAKDIGVFRKLIGLQSASGRDADQHAKSMFAIVRGDRAERADKIEALLDQGVPVGARGPGGMTALHNAARYSQLKTIALLIERGADLAITDDAGNTALDITLAAGKADAAALLEHDRS